MSNRENDVIKRAIQSIAWHGRLNSKTGAMRETARITGYVSKIHTDTSDPLCGTIDVQEYDSVRCDENGDPLYDGIDEGLHEGVYLSAMQDSAGGYVIVPRLYSEVTISKDAGTNKEYVVMYSHVSLIQLDAHDTVRIAVRGREDYDTEDEYSDDVHELKETGERSVTEYSKSGITTTVENEENNIKTVSEISSDRITQSVGDKSSITVKPDEIDVTVGSDGVTVKEKEVTVKGGDSQVKVTNDTVYVGADSNTDDAVLGVQLATVLSELLGYMSQMLTTTALGPQAPINVANFISLKAKVDAYKSAHTGFLTKKVQIRK
jgi:hypothetical protein